MSLSPRQNARPARVSYRTWHTAHTQYMLTDSNRVTVPTPTCLLLPWTARQVPSLPQSFFLSAEGSLEPQIEDLINRINELQQAKKKSSEELGEAHALWKALHRELDSLNGEKVHLEEILSKKQEALRILQLHCQRKEGEAQRKYMLAEHADQISIHNSQIAESQGQRKLGWHVELLEASRGQHKDLWEFHMLKQRLAWEIRALQSSKEQLLTEERQARAKLEEVEQRLRSPPEVPGTSAEKDGLKAELEKLGGRSPPRPRAPQKSEPANERPAGNSPVGATWHYRRSWP
ncbi:synaptonemal complex central element protein 1-like isoform X4 [Phacochoerus africanus]|uniref:synaptonemal complex central element protein 1-like isoform X4 n=1 Tax=Phacochoerus africanus TaxID=41426 RepID=UPI001FD9DCC2|nr:synaptonemal complex central element protein 1-like isoform X4 [Phacochoerus africanus]